MSDESAFVGWMLIGIFSTSVGLVVYWQSGIGRTTMWRRITPPVALGCAYGASFTALASTLGGGLARPGTTFVLASISMSALGTYLFAPLNRS